VGTGVRIPAEPQHCVHTETQRSSGLVAQLLAYAQMGAFREASFVMDTCDRADWTSSSDSHSVHHVSDPAYADIEPRKQ